MKNNSLLLLVIVLFLVSCNTGNKVASSFSKRKYSKGYFLDRPSQTKTVFAAQKDNKTFNTTHNTPVILCQPQTPKGALSDGAVKVLQNPTKTPLATNNYIVNNKLQVISHSTEIYADYTPKKTPKTIDPENNPNKIHNMGRPALILAGVVALAVLVGFLKISVTMTVFGPTISTVGTIALIIFILALVASLICAVPPLFIKDYHPIEGLIALVIDLGAIALLAFGNLFNN